MIRLLVTLLFATMTLSAHAGDEALSIDVPDWPANPQPSDLITYKDKDIAKAITTNRVCMFRIGTDFVTHSVGRVVEKGGGPGRLKAKRGIGRKLVGLEPAHFQSLADLAHDELAAALTAKGFEVLSYEECSQAKNWQKIKSHDGVGEVYSFDGLKFSFAKVMSAYTGASKGVRYIAKGRPDYNMLFGDVKNSMINGGKAAAQLDAILVDLDFVVDFTRHTGKIDVSTSTGAYYTTVTTKWEIYSEDLLFMSFVKGVFENGKYKIAHLQPVDAPPAVKDTSYILSAKQTDEAWNKKVTEGTVEITVDPDRYVEIVGEMIRAYTSAYAQVLAENRKAS